MRAREFLIEKINGQAAAGDPLSNLKAIISKKIKALPADKATEKALRGIEEMLSHLQTGGTRGKIQTDLDALNDRDVNKAKSLLAKYIYSLDADPQERENLFKMWKADKLIDRNLLLSPGRHSIVDVVNGYGESPVIKELTDDLAKVEALGRGKGEFLLSVFSKGITKLNKGDLAIDDKTVEVKTYDIGGARFYDQEVRPTPNFQLTVNQFRENWAKEVESTLNMSIKKSGLRLVDMMEFADALDTSRKEKYFQDCEAVIQNLFPGVEVDNIMQAFRVNNLGIAKQAYAVANLNYYLQTKKDYGILFIDLRKDPVSLIFFRDNNELNEGGFRLHAATIYPITNDPRNAYPQMQIIPTKAKTQNEAPLVDVPKAGEKSVKKMTGAAKPVAAKPMDRQQTIKAANQQVKKGLSKKDTDTGEEPIT